MLNKKPMYWKDEEGNNYKISYSEELQKKDVLLRYLTLLVLAVLCVLMYYLILGQMEVISLIR